MYAGLEGDGPFGNSTGVGPWRSFLTEEYAKNFVKRGGIGIADSVYKSLLTMQEARAK
jgi:Rod binding domain-containing protein